MNCVFTVCVVFCVCVALALAGFASLGICSPLHRFTEASATATEMIKKLKSNTNIKTVRGTTGRLGSGSSGEIRLQWHQTTTTSIFITFHCPLVKEFLRIAILLLSRLECLLVLGAKLMATA